MHSTYMLFLSHYIQTDKRSRRTPYDIVHRTIILPHRSTEIQNRAKKSRRKMKNDIMVIDSPDICLYDNQTNTMQATIQTKQCHRPCEQMEEWEDEEEMEQDVGQ